MPLFLVALSHLRRTHTWLGPLGVANQAPEPVPIDTSSTMIVVQPDMVRQCVKDLCQEAALH